jgi:hypothetical protein
MTTIFIVYTVGLLYAFTVIIGFLMVIIGFLMCMAEGMTVKDSIMLGLREGWAMWAGD